MASSSSSSSRPCSSIPPVPPNVDGWTELEDLCKLTGMTEEELEAEYDREVETSEGFDVQSQFGMELCGGIVPLPLPLSSVSSIGKSLKECAEEAIKDYNAKNGTDLEIVEIEKATMGGCYGTRYYITFKVKPTNTSADHPTTTFQAKVLDMDGLTIEICRIKQATN